MPRTIRLFCIIAMLGALGACKKKEAEQPPETPPAPAAGEGAGLPATPAPEPAPAPPEPSGGREGVPSADESETVLAALEASAGALAAMDEGPEDGPETPPFDRMEVLVDVTAVRGTPIWQMFEAGFTQYQELAHAADDGVPEDRSCFLGLLDKVTQMYLTLQPNAEGRPSGLVVMKAQVAADEVKTCLTSLLRDDLTLEEREIAGRTAFTRVPSDRPHVVVEAAPGTWVVGDLPAVEAALTGNAPLEPDAAFSAAAGTLGTPHVRIVVVPSDAFRSVSGKFTHPAVRCMADAFSRVRTIAIGAGIGDDFRLAAAAGYADAAQSTEAQQCLEALWVVGKASILSEIPPGAEGQIEEALGMTPEQLLDLVKIETSGEAVVVSLTMDGGVMERVMAMMQAQMMARASGPEEPETASPAVP